MSDDSLDPLAFIDLIDKQTKVEDEHKRDDPDGRWERGLHSIGCWLSPERRALDTSVHWLPGEAAWERECIAMHAEQERQNLEWQKKHSSIGLFSTPKSSAVSAPLPRSSSKEAPIPSPQPTYPDGIKLAPAPPNPQPGLFSLNISRF